MNLENVPKLVTREDPYHIHKTIGAVSLGHFAYRYYQLIRYNSMNIHNNFDMFLLFVNLLLQSSSFQFIIPQTRNKRSPMIYPEFRLHNLLFSYRSILCTMFFYYKFPIMYNIMLCYLTMIAADIVTHYYKDGTTMRGMHFDENVPDEKKQNITLFHSKMQLCASTYMLGNIDSAFSPLFAIQFSSFLMTLVRKNIIKKNHWHLLYGLSLMINVFVYYSLRFDFIVFQLLAYKLLYYLRLTKHYNKYLCWTLVYGFFLIYRQYPYTIIYETMIKNMLILTYFVFYLPYFI